MGNSAPIEYKRWQYTYSGWIRLIKCKDMTKEEEAAFNKRVWDDKEFGAMCYKEYNDWLNEEGDSIQQMADDLLESKKRPIRNTGKYKGRGKERP